MRHLRVIDGDWFYKRGEWVIHGAHPKNRAGHEDQICTEWSLYFRGDHLDDLPFWLDLLRPFTTKRFILRSMWDRRNESLDRAQSHYRRNKARADIMEELGI